MIHYKPSILGTPVVNMVVSILNHGHPWRLMQAGTTMTWETSRCARCKVLEKQIRGFNDQTCFFQQGLEFNQHTRAETIFFGYFVRYDQNTKLGFYQKKIGFN